MIKVRFLKEHVKWKAGDIAVLDNTQAAYLEKMKVAEMQGIERPEETEKVLFQHLEPEKKKNAIRELLSYDVIDDEQMNKPLIKKEKTAAEETINNLHRVATEPAIADVGSLKAFVEKVNKTKPAPKKAAKKKA